MVDTIHMLVPSGCAVTDDSLAVGACPRAGRAILTSMANCAASPRARSTCAWRSLRRRLGWRLASRLWWGHLPTIHFLRPCRRLTVPSVWTASAGPTSRLTGGRRHCVVPHLSREISKKKTMGKNRGYRISKHIDINHIYKNRKYIYITYIYMYIFYEFIHTELYID